MIKHWCYFFFFLISISLTAQNKVELESIPFTKKIIGKHLENRLKIKGDYFLSKDWQQGDINFKSMNINLSQISLRYFVYSQEMHFIFNGDTLSAPASNHIQSVKINNQNFICTAYQDKESIQYSYFEQLCCGKLYLLKKYQCTLIEGVKYAKNNFSTLKPDKYKIKVDYFIQKEGNPATKISSKTKEFLKCFPDNNNLISNYLKADKLKVKKEEDLIKIIDYYNSLQ